MTYNEVYNSFQKLNENDKKEAIIDFLKNNISSMQKINKDINNELNSDITNIYDNEFSDYLDAIYSLLHIYTEQVESFAEKISANFYE